MRHLLRLIAFVAVLAGLVSPRIAFADEQMQQARIIATPGSPISLTTCTFRGVETTQNAINRTGLFLQSFTVRWTAFDHAGNPMGQKDDYFTFDSDLAPGDSALKTNAYAGVPLTEPYSSLSTWRCRMQAAKFEGGKSWVFGHTPWRSPLSPMPKTESFAPTLGDGDGATVPVSRVQGSAPGLVAFIVANAWNDNTNIGTIVHVTIDVKGTAKEFSLRPSDVSLKLALANGAKKAYGAMTQPAPSYQKINALTNQMVTTAEVDPKSDLGGLGSILIPPNGNVRVTASFMVGSDVLANPNDNRDVAIR